MSIFLTREPRLEELPHFEMKPCNRGGIFGKKADSFQMFLVLFPHIDTQGLG